MRGPDPDRDLVEEIEPTLLLRIDRGEEFETDDGRPVQIFTTTGPGDFPLVGVVGPEWFATQWNTEGTNKSGNSALNLVTPKKSIKAALYRNLKTGRYGLFMQDDVPDPLTWEWLSEHEIPLPKAD